MAYEPEDMAMQRRASLWSEQSGLSESPEALQARLLPLLHIEQLLIARLVPPDEDEPTRLPAPSPFQASMNQFNPRAGYYEHQEVFVRSGLRWKGALAKSRRRSHASGSSGEASDDNDADPDEAQKVLYECRDDMIRLWEDPGIKDILWRKKIRLEEQPGLYVFSLSIPLQKNAAGSLNMASLFLASFYFTAI
jgi:guanine nucleotide-binding protein alpha-1 subunit